MKTWISACAILLCSFVAGIAATTYTITLTVSGGTIAYDHDKGHGKRGHQIVSKDDKIVWVCAQGSCTKPTVKFKSNSPCALPGTTCDVNYGDTGVFPYSIGVIDKGGNVVIDDPDVIVDNSGMLPQGGKRGRNPDQAAPKKK